MNMQKQDEHAQQLLQINQIQVSSKPIMTIKNVASLHASIHALIDVKEMEFPLQFQRCQE